MKFFFIPNTFHFILSLFFVLTMISHGYVPPNPSDSGNSEKIGNACCVRDDTSNDCLFEDPQGGVEFSDCDETVSTINAEIILNDGSVFNDCRRVINKRTDGRSVSTSFRTISEWDSFIAYANRADSPVEVSSCYCGRKLTTSELYVALDWNPRSPSSAEAQIPPHVGTGPGFHEDAQTGGKLCELLSCGPLVNIYGTPYGSPGDNAVLIWDGANWIKLPAVGNNDDLGGSGWIECEEP